MAPISNASRLAEFGSGIGTDGAVIQVDNINKRVGIGTTNPQGMLQVGQGVTVYGSTGIVSATEYWGDGSNLDGLVSAAVTQYIAADSITSSGIVTITNTTDATSTSTGALIISGGVGIAKSLHVGQNITIGGTLTYEDVTNVDSIGVVTARSGVNISGGQLLVGSGVTIGNAGVATFSGTGDVHLLDSVKLNVGDGSDLQVYHNGTHSYVQHTYASGNFFIESAANIAFKVNTNESALNLNSNGSAEIYHDNSKKWETTNDGTVTTGISTATGGLAINADSKNLTIGAGEDLKLYHNGSHSYADNGTGSLFVRSDNQMYFQATNGDRYADFVDGGAVKLYYSNAAENKKFETTNDGVVITGICTADGVRVGDSEEIILGVGNDFKLRHDGTDNHIASANGAININVADTETAAVFTPNGSVDLYHDNVLTFSTQAAGITVQGGEGGSAQINLFSDEGDDNEDKWRITKESGNHSFRIQNYSTGSWVTGLTLDQSNNATFAAAVSDSKGDVRQIIYQNKTGSYTLVATDAGKAIHISTGGVTIDNSIFSAGDAVTIVNNSGSSQTITQGSGVTLYNTGDDGSTGNKTLKGRGICTVWFSSASIGYITGNFE